MGRDTLCRFCGFVHDPDLAQCPPPPEMVVPVVVPAGQDPKRVRDLLKRDEMRRKYMRQYMREYRTTKRGKKYDGKRG